MDPYVLPPNIRKRSRTTEEDDASPSKSKIKHSGSNHHSAIPTPEPAPVQAATVDSLPPPVIHRSSIADEATGEQNPTLPASMITTRDQLTTSAVHAVNSTTSVQTKDSTSKSTAPRKLRLRVSRKNDQQDATSAVPAPEKSIGTRARTAINRPSETPLTHTDGQSNKLIMSRASSATNTPIATTENLERAGPPKVPKGHTGHAVSSEALTTTVPSIIPRAPTYFSSSPVGREGFLRWKSSPFTLIHVRDRLWCPRLEVHQTSQLCRVLAPGSYALDTAAMRIHEYGGLGKPLPCEANKILILYDKIQRLKVPDPHVTYLDPEFFGTSCRRSLEEQIAFQKRIRGWINHLGHQMEFPEVFRGTWDFKSLRVDYMQFRISLCLSTDNDQTIYIPPPNLQPPKRTKPLQLYNDFQISATLREEIRKPAIFEDVIFCHRWMGKCLDPESICAAMKWRNNEFRLMPHHINLVSSQAFDNTPEYNSVLTNVEDLTEQDRQRRKSDFWYDFHQAQGSDPFLGTRGD